MVRTAPATTLTLLLTSAVAASLTKDVRVHATHADLVEAAYAILRGESLSSEAARVTAKTQDAMLAAGTTDAATGVDTA